MSITLTLSSLHLDEDVTIASGLPNSFIRRLKKLTVCLDGFNSYADCISANSMLSILRCLWERYNILNEDVMYAGGGLLQIAARIANHNPGPHDFIVWS